jgi:hypothetical protein
MKPLSCTQIHTIAEYYMINVHGEFLMLHSQFQGSSNSSVLSQYSNFYFTIPESPDSVSVRVSVCSLVTVPTINTRQWSPFSTLLFTPAPSPEFPF